MINNLKLILTSFKSIWKEILIKEIILKEEFFVEIYAVLETEISIELIL